MIFRTIIHTVIAHHELTRHCVSGLGFQMLCHRERRSEEEKKIFFFLKFFVSSFNFQFPISKFSSSHFDEKDFVGGERESFYFSFFLKSLLDKRYRHKHSHRTHNT